MKRKWVIILFFLAIFIIGSCHYNINKISYKSLNGISIEKIDSSMILISKVKNGLKKGKSKIIDLKNGDYIIGEYRNNKKEGAWCYYHNDTLYKVDVYWDDELHFLYKIIDNKRKLIRSSCPSF